MKRNSLGPTRIAVSGALGCWAALVLGGASLLAFTAAQAADPGTSNNPNGPNDQVEEVVITGTLIRNTAPVGSTVIGVTPADIQQSGANTISEMLQNLPQVDNLGVTESSRTGTGGATNIVWGNSIDLRGLSPYATLTLVDGHRAPPAGTSGATVDPDSFPSIMLQRIDVVADGASATYGSDAIAGVVNLILRRDVEGVEAKVRFGTANSYDEHQIGVLAGHQWSTGQISLGYEDDFHSNLNGENRAFYESNQTAEGGGDYQTPECNPGNIVIGNTIYAIPKGGVTPATANLLVPNTQNHCDTAKHQDILPEVEHNDFALTFDQKINDAISLYGDGTFAKRTYAINFPQSTGPLEVPTSNAYFVQPPGSTLTACPPPGAGMCEQVDYSFGGDIGYAERTYGESINAQGTVGVKVKLGADWLLNLDGTAGRDSDWIYAPPHALDQGNLAAALASSNPATALNVFGGGNSASVLSGIFDDRFYGPGFAGEQVMEGQADGPLFHLPGGDVRLAVGGQWRHDELLYGINSGIPAGPELIIRNTLNRHSESEFAELLVPIVGHDNAMPGIQSLVLDVAGRHEDYSDFGSTSHPKIGVNWVPADGWLVHGSYGTSFRAPLLSELVGPLRGVFVQTYSDPLSPSGTSVGYTLGGGNLQLKPETATTYSFGVDFKPTDNAKLSLTYYNINYQNQISSYLADLTILQQIPQLGSLVNRCPSAACTALITEYVTGPGALPLFGPPLANPSVFVNGEELNLGTTRTSGFDFQGNYVIPTVATGRWSVGLSANLTTQFDVQFTPGGPSFNELNTIGYPLRFRFRGNVGWAGGPWTTVAFINFENSYTNTEATPNQSISALTTVDLDAAYDFGKTVSASWSKDLVLTLHIMNVTNAMPPYVNIPIGANGGGGFDPGAANPIGRLVSLGVGKKF
jgi:iron complex outermembrane receptor protein